MGPVSQTSQDSDLVRGVDTFNVKSWIGLGKPFVLGFFQSRIKTLIVVRHFAENIISSAINNAFYGYNFVGNKCFSNGTNNRNRTTNSCFKPNGNLMVISNGKNFVTIICQ